MNSLQILRGKSGRDLLRSKNIIKLPPAINYFNFYFEMSDTRYGM